MFTSCLRAAVASRCWQTLQLLQIPANAHCIWVVHLLTGTILVSESLDRGWGVLLLALSFVIVFALCCCPSGAFGFDGFRTERKEEKDPGNHSESDDLEGNPAVAKQTSAVREGQDDTSPKLVTSADASSSSTGQPVDVTRASQEGSREASAANGRRGDSTPAHPDGGLTIGMEASLLEGLRGLLAIHLRRSEVMALSESQAELLEHHLTRLSSYSQKIVHTIAFAQRVFAQACEAEETRQAEGEEDAQAEKAEEAQKKKKKLKLKDGEILHMYSLAQREAELEADWRGIDNMTSHTQVNLEPSSGSQEHVVASRCGWRLPDGSNVALPAIDRHDGTMRQERREAIELLGQALATRDGGPDDALAARLIPVRRPRPCDEIIGDTNMMRIRCCDPAAQGSGEFVNEHPSHAYASQYSFREQANVASAFVEPSPIAGDAPTGVRVFSDPPHPSPGVQQEVFASTASGGVLAVSPADVRMWLDDQRRDGPGPSLARTPSFITEQPRAL